MKKSLVLLIMLALSLFMFGCKKNNDNNNEEEKKEENLPVVVFEGVNSQSVDIVLMRILGGKEAECNISLENSDTFIERLNGVMGLEVSESSVSNNLMYAFRINNIEVMLSSENVCVYGNKIYKLQSDVFSTLLDGYKILYTNDVYKFENEVTQVEFTRDEKKYYINSEEHLNEFNLEYMKIEYVKINMLTSDKVKYEVRLAADTIMYVYESGEFKLHGEIYDCIKGGFGFLDFYDEGNTDSEKNDTGWLGWI